jgi:hypothetical protein
MSINYQYGRGLSDALVYGMFLAYITARIKELNVPIEQSLMFHNTFESLSALATPSEEEKKKTIQKNVRTLKAELAPKIERINEWIELTNQFIHGLDFRNIVIPTLEQDKILSLVEKRLKTVYELEDAQKISNENFRLRLYNLLQTAPTEIFAFRKVVEKEKYSEDIQDLKEATRQGMRQAFDVCSIGYYSTSVFIGGRTVEECINSFYEKIFRLGLLPTFDLKK